MSAPPVVPAATPAAAVGGPPKSARLAVLGASGYAGGEFIRLAVAHPGLTVVAAVSRDAASTSFDALVPGVDPRAEKLPVVVDIDGLVALLEDGALDTLVTCLPHGAWRTLAAERPALAATPVRILDLSSDHRDGSAGYRYGLPEAFRTTLTGATHIANPGCYATAAALALLPAAETGALGGDVTVVALSGATGAGRSTAARTQFVELDGGAAFYKVGSEHPHVVEMERTLAALRPAGAGLAAPAVGFAPSLVPMARGILLTAQAALTTPLSPAEARALYARRYDDEPFVRLLPLGQWPETRAVRSSNRCDVQVTTLFGGRTLLATAAIDNLGKGAAGQALQNLNLALGWPETTALQRHGQAW
ncbi:MAG: N-acetyl-gamma-glutamyl-phosphate reductase [Candidatus Eisenbacteria bacterium]